MLNVPWLCGGGLVAAILAVRLSGCAGRAPQTGKGGDESALHRLLEDYYQARRTALVCLGRAANNSPS